LSEKLVNSKTKRHKKAKMASKEAAGLTQTIHSKQDKLAPDSVIVDGVDGRADSKIHAKPLADVNVRQHGIMDEQFPTAGLSAANERDKIMEAKIALQKAPGMTPGMTPFGKLEAKEADFKWLQEKQAAAEAANFQRWFAEEFDHMSPAEKKRAKELYPEFYAQRKKLLKQQTKNLFALARLKLEGIQNRDDLITQYLAETGRLDIGPLTHILNPELGENQAAQAARFQRGLLSPFRVFGTESIHNTNMNMFDARAEQSNEFAHRTAASRQFGAELGLATGFPPMNNANAKQGDLQWWTALQQ
jgi:hypothetical protein